MIPDRLLEEVRARADIVEIIGEVVPLKRAGKDFRAHCPFHHEKTPSFYVVPAKGFYKCFGCGESGDVFTFLMKRSGATFLEAVRQVAAKVGVEIPAAEADPQADEPHRALFEAVAFAADHYRGELAAPTGSLARAYLEGRGLAGDVADRFLLGYAPDGWRGLRDAAHRHGIDDEVLLAAGLIKESERAEEPYDRFRDRILFPIAEASGRLVAFGGRALRPAENVPKYLNSPETPIYQKGHVLYGLNWSRRAIRREGAALVVEGYMDYVSLAARGIDNVVAGMGTALTPEQANLVARYTAKAFLLYDSDSAGLRASFRSADALLRAGVHPLVVTLPVGDDPDSLVRRGGVAALQPLLESAADVLDRKLQMLGDRGYFADSDGARRALDRLLPTVRATIDPALRDIYVARVAERTGVRRETIEYEVESGPSQWTGGARHRDRGGRSPARVPAAAVPGSGERGSDFAAERLLLLLLLRDPTRTEMARARLQPDDFSEPAHRELFEAFLARGVDGGGTASLRLGARAALLLSALERDPTEVADAERSFEDAVADIREIRSLFRQLDELDVRVTEARDEAEQALILRERTAVWTALRARAAVADHPFKAYRRHRRAAPERAARPGESSTDGR